MGSTRTTVGLGALFSTILASAPSGCEGPARGNCNGSIGTSRQENITAAQYEEAVRDDGTVAYATCKELCSPTVGSVRSCRVFEASEPFSTSGGSLEGFVGGMGGTSFGGEGGAGGEMASSAGGTEGGGYYRVKCSINEPLFCTGRRHAAIEAALVGAGPTMVAAWLERAAACEAVSVSAFLALRDELREHGAPPQLVDAAEVAADDERRHAASMRALARRAGGRAPATTPAAEISPRSLLDLALENAVEGCVNETFAALLATHQARSASTPTLRAAMEVIADDETRHGELAWAIHAWACCHLSDDQVTRVEAAICDAGKRLVDGIAAEPLDPTTRSTLGLPSANDSARLAHELQQHLWS